MPSLLVKNAAHLLPQKMGLSDLTDAGLYAEGGGNISSWTIV